MNLKLFANRVKCILSEPKKEFQKIKAEEKIPKKILIDFIIPLVIINALASFLGVIIFSEASFTIGSGIVLKKVIFIAVVQITSVYLAAYLVNELLPIFHMVKNFNVTFRLIAYSFTAAIPATTIFFGLPSKLSNFIIFLGFYAVVTLWIGCDVLFPKLQDRKQLFVPVAIIAAALIYLASSVIFGLILPS